MTPHLQLDDRAFIVFGGGNGIGAATVRALRAAGAKVACVDRDRRLAESVAAETGSLALDGDVLVRSEVTRLIDEAQTELGPIRGLVSIPGQPRSVPLAELSDEDWTWQFDIVLKHAFLSLQIGASAIAAAGGGTIVFVGSIAGHSYMPQQTGYGTAKAALHHLVYLMGRELAPQGVRVNAVAPGVVRTPRAEATLSAEQWAAVEAAIPTGEVPTTDEIAGTILFLCSPLSKPVVGHVLHVDSGMAGQVPLTLK
jgi:NAD(P)-dependent dehydrogenase (short-subunit alcohol dehydrogenase family)